MPCSIEDADECQKCEDGEATQSVSINVGGFQMGPLFVCDDCVEETNG